MGTNFVDRSKPMSLILLNDIIDTRGVVSLVSMMTLNDVFIDRRSDGMLHIGNTQMSLHTSSDKAMVPDVIFYDNPLVSL